MTEVKYTTEQRRALEEIQDLVRTQPAIGIAGHLLADGDLVVVMDLDTSPFEKVDGGLPVQRSERLYTRVSAAWPWVPPRVEVDHHRWDDQAHVLQGFRLCIYLDPATEWDPSAGMAGFLERLWDWFADAIANRFDSATALYHPVGGVLHRTPGAPTIVASAPIDNPAPGFHIAGIQLRQRSENRVDVVAWNRQQRSDATFPGVLAVLSDSLPLGGGSHLSDLAIAIRGQDARHQRRQFLAAISKTARALGHNQHLHVIVAVPNRHLKGETRLHLVGWRLPQPHVGAAVAAARNRHKPDEPHTDGEPRVEWTYIDDTRSAVTTRRDSQRPVTWFAGKTIEVWGCGAIGSWLAEHVVRAGASAIVLRDSGFVTSGLLVRQNYTELDVGRAKVEALAERLTAMSDQATVTPIHGLAQPGVADANGADVVFDCTVNTSVAMAIDRFQTEGQLTTPVIQVATDNATTTLGILTATSGRQGQTTNQVDKQLEEAASSEPHLRAFRAFWDHQSHPPLTPTIGCSVPTFHGSSADSSGIAATAVTLAAIALKKRVSVGYLFASAHTPFDVPLRTHVAIIGDTVTDVDIDVR